MLFRNTVKEGMDSIAHVVAERGDALLKLQETLAIIAASAPPQRSIEKWVVNNQSQELEQYLSVSSLTTKSIGGVLVTTRQGKLLLMLKEADTIVILHRNEEEHCARVFSSIESGYSDKGKGELRRECELDTLDS